MLDNSQEYRRGEPIDYTSCYGYPKVRYQIVRVSDGAVVGHAKEERVPDQDGLVCTKVYYTRDIGRDYGMLRFYASPEALIIGFGGKVSEWQAEQKAKEPDDVSAMKAAPKGEGMATGESFKLDPGLEARVTALENKVFLAKHGKVNAKPAKKRKAVAKSPARRVKKLA